MDCENWVWFKEKLEDDFPGIRIWMSDADKGITSSAFSMSLSQSVDEFVLSRCAWHLADNCKESCKGPMNTESKNKIIDLARSRTEDVYQRRLAEIRSLNEKWADYLDSKKQQFVACSFLQRGYMRYGKVTSNGVETINGSLVDARSLPIVSMIQDIIKYQQERYNERKVQAHVWKNDGKLLTDYAERRNVEVGSRANKRDVQMIESIHPLYKAKVSVGDNANRLSGYLEVSVNVEDYSRSCPCKGFEEERINCVHVKALLLQLGPLGTSVHWFDERFHLDTYVASYSAPLPGLTTAGKLKIDDSFVPPEYKRTAGRPSKKRRDRSQFRNKTDVLRICRACGEKGHFAAACTQPSTEYRFNLHKAGAIAWCNNIERIDIQED